jgi:hypothetical protein
MSMQRALQIELHGAMPPAKLKTVRDLLHLLPDGRLQDLDDSSFGHRYLRHDESNLIVLRIYRYRAMEWEVTLTYLNEPPAAETVERCRSEILAAAERVELTPERVWVNPIFTRDS